MKNITNPTCKKSVFFCVVYYMKRVQLYQGLEVEIIDCVVTQENDNEYAMWNAHHL